MPSERIDRYKKTPVLKFQDSDIESGFHKYQSKRGRSTSIFALSALGLLNLAYAFLEYWILGLNSMIPLTTYLVIALISFCGVGYSLLSASTRFFKLRILVPGVLTFATLLAAVVLEQYRIYHAVEAALLMIWLASLNILRVSTATILASAILVFFTGVAFLNGASEIKLSGLVAVELGAFSLAIYLAYMMERFRRMLYLTGVELTDVYCRQESWAFTLIDLDMALSGIRDFKEMTERLVEYMKQAVDYDSYILTALEGKGPKPPPDKIEGALFEDEDVTLWPDDLMTKLSQTRHAVASAQFEESKGFLGRKKIDFLHFRLDVPIFDDSSLVGVIGFRRRNRPYDDLDKTASVSLTSQAMMIFKRTEKSTQMSDEILRNLASRSAQAPQPAPRPAVNPITEQVVEIPSVTAETSTNIEITQDSTSSELDTGQVAGVDESVVSPAMLQKIKQEAASARKTITLLSRENADQIAVGKYRTAAVEGEPLSILLIEVDGLSSIRENDGDQAAYKVFAGIVKYVFSRTDREKDVLGRYGQNGMSVLLPRVDMNAAERFAESLREHVEGTPFTTPFGERKATLSIGVAAFTDDTGNYESMVKRADMALFVAKKNGRNCVKVRL